MNFEKIFYISNINFADESNIDVSFLPPMARRKLSQIDKAALCVMNSTFNQSECKEPVIIFSSQYGELDRLDKIISQYQEDNEVSPFTFSTSVHNSIVGQFSLLNGIKKSYNALASGDNSLSIGLLESYMSASDENDVLYCYADAYKEVKACALCVSLKPSDGAIKVLLKQNDCEKTSADEFLDFKGFCENKVNSFASYDGLFSVFRGES